MSKVSKQARNTHASHCAKRALVGTLALSGALCTCTAQETAQAWAEELSISAASNSLDQAYETSTSNSAPAPEAKSNSEYNLAAEHSALSGTSSEGLSTSTEEEATSNTPPTASTSTSEKPYRINMRLSQDSSTIISSNGDQEATLALVLQVSGEDTLTNNATLSLDLSPDARAYLSISDIKTNLTYTTSSTDTNTRLDFTRLQGGDSLGLVAHVRLQKGMNPNMSELTIGASLTNSEGVILATSQNITLSAKTTAPELRPYIGIHGNAYVGKAQDGWVSQAVAVPYMYNTGPDNPEADRLASQIEYRVTLPSYTNKQGKLVFAQIDSNTSSEWVLSADKHTVSFTATAPAGEAIYNYAQIRPVGSLSAGKAINVPYLYLLFPEAKIGTSIENQAELIVTPYNPIPGEQNLTASARNSLILADKGNPLNVNFVLKADSAEVEDILGARKEEQSWTASISTFMRKDVDKLALRFNSNSDLYVSSLSRNGKSDLIDHISSIEGKTTHDTWEPLTIVRTQENGQTKSISLDSSKAYNELRIVFDPSYTLPKGFGLYSLKINTRFKNPETISSSTHPEAFEALAVLSGMSTQDLDYVNQSYSTSFTLAPFEYKYRFGVNKILDSVDQTLAVGDRFKIGIGVRNNVPFGEELTGRRLAIELPVGVSLALEGPTPEALADNGLAAPRPYNGPVEYLDMSSATKGYDAYTHYQLEENYNNTGKRILFIDLPNLAKGNLDEDPYMYGNIFRVSFVADKYLIPDDPTTAYTINLPVYYTFNHTGNTHALPVKNSLFISSATAPDVLNLTSKLESLIPKASLSFPIEVPRILSGQSLAGTNESSLSPYPLYLGTQDNFNLGIYAANYSNIPQHGVVIYNQLPSKTTKPETSFLTARTEDLINATNVVLTGPVNAPTGYEVYYLKEEPSEDPTLALKQAGWTKAPTSYDKVRAIKLVGLEGTSIRPNERLTASMPVKLEEEGTGGHVFNSFSFVSEEFPNPTTTYAVDIVLPIQYALSTQWLDAEGNPFAEELPQGITIPQNTSATITGRVAGLAEPVSTTTIHLDAAGNWSAQTALLPSVDSKGREIHYAITAAQQEGWNLGAITLNNRHARWVYTYAQPTKPAPTPTPAPDPQPEGTPQPTPAPAPQPGSAPAPAPQPVPDPAPAPKPEPTPVPVPQPGTTPQPQPVPDPQPAPNPAPNPTPAPTPQSEGTPHPDPTPQPEHQPAPVPQPDVRPLPQPTPEPEVQPIPETKPTPTPQPEPQANTTPASKPQPKPQLEQDNKTQTTEASIASSQVPNAHTNLVLVPHQEIRQAKNLHKDKGMHALPQTSDKNFVEATLSVLGILLGIVAAPLSFIRRRNN